MGSLERFSPDLIRMALQADWLCYNSLGMPERLQKYLPAPDRESLWLLLAPPSDRDQYHQRDWSFNGKYICFTHFNDQSSSTTLFGGTISAHSPAPTRIKNTWHYGSARARFHSFRWVVCSFGGRRAHGIDPDVFSRAVCKFFSRPEKYCQVECLQNFYYDSRRQ